MWKYVSRRIRDTFERSSNCFDIRNTTGVANATSNNFAENENKKSCPLSRWHCPRKFRNSFQEDSNTNNKRWNFDHLNNSWLGAITWSSGLVLGWYASHLIDLKQKYLRKDIINRPSHNNFYHGFKPYLSCASTQKYVFPKSQHIETPVLSHVPPAINLITNEQNGSDQKERLQSESSTSSDNDLDDVLNSIENRLGLAAIGNGQHHDGLNLLRSAANRKYAPAMFNLGLCYELGLGMKIDEKMAVELYRSAAALQHPGALYNLSIYYGQGRGGLPRDTETATRLLRLAAIKGEENAIKALKALDIPPMEENITRTDTWAYSYLPYVQSDNTVSKESSHFAANLPFLHTAQCEATVY